MSQQLSTSDPFRKMLTGFVLFIAVSLFAVVGYMLHGWAWDDAFYMVIITIFGVGYGEVQPITSPGLRALTVTVIIAGYGAVIYTVGGFMQMLVDGELKKALGTRRMNREIEKLNGHTIVCGFGRMGTMLTHELHESKKPFIIVEANPQKLEEAEALGYLVIQGDATDETVLERAGIYQAGVLATVLSDDAINVFVTITARAMNNSLTIIARGENPRTEKKLMGCGANEVVLPSTIGASRIAHLILRPTAESLLSELTHQHDLNQEMGLMGLQFVDMKVTSDSPLNGRKLNEIEVKGNYGFLIVGIRKENGESELNPTSETMLAQGDIVVFLGHRDDMPQVAKRFAKKSEGLQYRGVRK